MIVARGETFDEIYEQSWIEKTAEFYTWTHFVKTIIWSYLFYLTLFHVGFIAAVSTYVLDLHSEPMKWRTVIWAFTVGYASLLGNTAGAHRLWSHRTYKAKLPLRILLTTFYSVAGLYPLYYWVRDHRVHHKYSETDADPHNAKRGFIFSHYGWLVMKRHPECIRRVKEVDMSDIIADPVVMFQKKYGMQSRWLLCYIIPSLVPIIFWKESILHAVLSQCFIRYVIALNITFSINSVAHLWGYRPYNRFINPADNPILSFITTGEGSHNYHHTFPWDYKASELPYMSFNLTTAFINVMIKIGWAYDIREPSAELVKKVIHRLGDKSEVNGAY